MAPTIDQVKKEMEQKYGLNGGTTNKDMGLFLMHKLDSVDDKVGAVETKITNQVMFCKTHLKEKSLFSKGLSKVLTLGFSACALVIAVYAATH